jgi:hypothetical protein
MTDTPKRIYSIDGLKAGDTVAYVLQSGEAEPRWATHTYNMDPVHSLWDFEKFPVILLAREPVEPLKVSKEAFDELVEVYRTPVMADNTGRMIHYNTIRPIFEAINKLIDSVEKNE